MFSLPRGAKQLNSPLSGVLEGGVYVDDSALFTSEVAAIKWQNIGSYSHSYPVGRPIPMAARSNAWVCGRLLAGNAGSNATGGIGVCLL